MHTSQSRPPEILQISLNYIIQTPPMIFLSRNSSETEIFFSELSYELLAITHLVEPPCQHANAVPAAPGSARLLRPRSHELHFVSHSQSRCGCSHYIDHVSWYWYLLLGFVDVQGNYLVNEAYQFSSITSVTLLDCFTIAWVLLLTWIFLGARYSLWQLFGAVLCVVGLGVVLLSDAGVAGGGGSQPLLGDVLVIAGTIFFALSNVGEEFCVKKRDRMEVVCMIGVFGFLVSVCQISILELKSLESVEWSTDIILAFVGYGLAGFMLYTLGPFVLQMSGATLFNLSILTSDMWAVVVRIFFYHQEVDWLYYLSFAIVVIGLIIYSVMEKESAPVTSLEDGNPSYQILEDESAISRNESLVS
ncbi:hypothetical protein ACLB2K_056296 [Fragaria x ananassa]